MEESAEPTEVCRGLAKRLGAQRAWVVSAAGAFGFVQELRKRVQPGEFVETYSLGGAPLEVRDVRSLAREAKAERKAAFKAALKAWGAERKELGAQASALEKPSQPGPYVLCDNSMATFALCAAGQLGADIVLERLELCMAELGSGSSVGTSTSIGVTAPAPAESSYDSAPVVVAFSKDALSNWGSAQSLVPLLNREQQTYASHAPSAPARLAAALDAWDGWAQDASAAAQAVASYARCHPGIAQVFYPGLVQDKSYATASGILHNGFGPFVDLKLAFQSARDLAQKLTDTPELQAMGTHLADYGPHELCAPARPVTPNDTTLRILVLPASDLDFCRALERALAKHT